MSLQIQRALRRGATDVRGGTFSVLMAIADRANDDGVCWPGIDKIAEDAHVSPSTVDRAIKKLTQLGYLFVETGRGRNCSSVYRINTSLCCFIEDEKSVNTTSYEGDKTSNWGEMGEEKNVSLQQKNVILTKKKRHSAIKNVNLQRKNVNLTYKPSVNHQEPPEEPSVNRQDSGASVLRRATDPPPTEVEVEVEPEPATVGVEAEPAAKPPRKPRGKAEQKPKAPRPRKQTKHEWPEDFNVAYLWWLLEQEFGKLTWSTADWSRETAAANVVANAGIEEGVSEHDILAFLKYLAACDRRWKANGAEMPLLSRNHAQFGAWWAAGKPEQPNANTNGGYANGNGNGTRNGAGAAGRFGPGGLSKGNRALESGMGVFKAIRDSSPDNEELFGGQSGSPGGFASDRQPGSMGTGAGRHPR